MDVAALVISIVAVVVGLGSLGWQWFTWWHKLRLRICVRLDEVEKQVAGLPEAFETVFSVNVVNTSSFPVKVTGATLMVVGKPVRGYDAVDRLEVKPRDAEVIELPLGRFVGQLPSDVPIEAWVLLSTGEEFRSDPVRLLTRFGGPAE